MLNSLVSEILNGTESEQFYWYHEDTGFHEIVECDLFRGRFITDDGDFAHNILSPKKHISKTYNVTIDIDMNDDMVSGFKEGVNLNDGECKSASLEITGKNTGIVVLTEGRYHQIKRMFGCFGAKVIELERTKMGNFSLPDDLELGCVREFTNEELDSVRS